MIEWYDRETIRPPVNGSHFLACDRPASRGLRTFDEEPPVVIHWFGGDFWLSRGIVQGSYNDTPVLFTHWAVLGKPPEPARPLPDGLDDLERHEGDLEDRSRG